MDRRVLKAAKAIAALAQMDRSGDDPKDWDDLKKEDHEDAVLLAKHLIDLWDALNAGPDIAVAVSGSKKKGRK